MKKFIHIVVAIIAIIFITGCTSTNQSASYGATAGGYSGGSRKVAVTRKVPRERIIQAAPMQRIESDPGTWNAEAAIRYAETNNLHDPRFKPCRTDGKGGMTVGDEPWYDKEGIRSFYKGLGTRSPYCGATLVKGSDYVDRYEEEVTDYEDVPLESGGPSVVHKPQSTVNNRFSLIGKVEVEGHLHEGRSSYPIFSSGRSRYREREHVEHFRPRPCMSCQHVHAPGRCPRVNHRDRDRDHDRYRPIARRDRDRDVTIRRIHNINRNHNTIIRNAPPGMRAPRHYGGSSRGGFKPGPGRKLYR